MCRQRTHYGPLVSVRWFCSHQLSYWSWSSLEGWNFSTPQFQLYPKIPLPTRFLVPLTLWFYNSKVFNFSSIFLLFCLPNLFSELHLFALDFWSLHPNGLIWLPPKSGRISATGSPELLNRVPRTSWTSQFSRSFKKLQRGRNSRPKSNAPSNRTYRVSSPRCRASLGVVVQVVLRSVVPLARHNFYGSNSMC